MIPNFYAIIPASVRYDKKLTANAKLLYGEITALCNQEGFCWADNKYFSELYEVDGKTISRWISQLKNSGFLKIEHFPEKGNIRKIYIENSAQNLVTKKSLPSDKKITTLVTKRSLGSDEKITSIYENNTINNTMNRDRENRSQIIDINYKNSLEFLEKNYPEQFEILMMQHKKRIDNWAKFSEMFEATVMMEKLVYELPVLKGRFLKFARNWIDNQKQFESKKEVIEINPMRNIKVS